ncbi:MAG: UMP kinase [Alphaproteobacteria bacterium]|nr:UMP kinase [Alphaproteobacteria bacterium]
MAKPVYRRVMLKISGEALMGAQGHGIDPGTVGRIAAEIKAVVKLGVEVCVTIGGGNVIRGVVAAGRGIERATADYMGMLGTVINGLALQSALERAGVDTRVQSAIRMDAVCEPFIRRRALRHIGKRRVVIFAGGTGNPFFTTDTTAALRAAEMNCQALLKATQVDGVYSADPKKVRGAKRYDQLSYTEVLARDLKVMDGAAIALMRENRIPIVVFSIHQAGAFARVMRGEAVCTTIAEEG